MTTTKEQLYDLLVRLYYRLKQPNDFVQISESWVRRNHGRINAHNVKPIHRNGNTIFEDVTPDMWCCLDNYTRSSRIMQEELHHIIRQLACDMMLELV